MKRQFAVAAFLLLALAFAVCAAPADSETAQLKMSKKAGKLMAKALKAIQDEQPDRAIELLQEVSTLEPENAMVRHNLGVLFFDKGLTAEAISNFEVALRLQPDYQNALLALRQALLEAGKKASSEQALDKSNEHLLKLNGLAVPPAENVGLRASACYLLGFNYFNLKQYEKADDYFAKCQAVEGLKDANRDLYANATYFLGMMGHIQGNYESSSENFRTYLGLYAGSETQPEFFSHANYFIGANLFRLLEARLAKGEVANMAAEAADIIPYLEQAIAAGIPSEDAHVMLGNCHVYRKQYEKAVQAYQKLITVFPQSPQRQNYEAFLAELQKMSPQDKKK